MQLERGPGPEATRTSVERVQSNSTVGRPLVLGSILIAVFGFLGFQMLSRAPEEAIPAPTTYPPIQTTLPDAPDELLELQGLGLSGAIAYPISDGVAVIDLATGAVNAITNISDTLLLGDFVVLKGVSGTFVIDKSEPTTVGLSQIEGEIVSTAVADRFVSVRYDGVPGDNPEADSGYAFTLMDAYGVEARDLGPVSGSEIAKDSEVQLVPGLGAVFEQPDGGTFIFGANGYQPFSDHRVLAASQTARVEMRCESRCTPFYVSDQEEILLPPVFEEDLDLSISPDGEWILLNIVLPPPGPTSVLQNSGAQLFRVSSQSLGTLGIGKPGIARWAADSSFVAWLEPENQAAELVMVFTPDRSTATINLEQLGAPDRLGDDVVLITG